jgi:hypothetical protein
VRSPGTVDCGTGRSSIGHTGFAVRAIEHEQEIRFCSAAPPP